jgi:nucleotide-binding universal stress UspA family protein
MLRRILVPLDGSALAARVLTAAHGLLLRSGAEVLLATVVPPHDDASACRDDARLRDAAEHDLDQHKQALGSLGIHVEARVVSGDPARAILQLAQERRADLLALSTHGRSGMARWLRGSVADRLIRTSPVPLFVANPFALPAHDDRELSLRKILVALDGSERSAAVLPLVAEIARIYEAEVVLFSAPELPLVADFICEDVVSSIEREAREWIQRQRLLHLAHVRSRIEIAPAFPGRAADLIVEECRRCAADLVAITTHGRSGVSRLYFGSVAETVLRTCRALLLVLRTAAVGVNLP